MADKKNDKKDDQKPEKKGESPQERLAAAMRKLKGQYGDAVIMQGGAIINVNSWPTQIASLDLALGCGGLPRGRVIELFGPESSGKTTLSLTCAAACYSDEFKRQHGREGVVAMIDAEHAFDPVWAARLGVDRDKLLFSQPGSGEEALQIACDLSETGAVDLVIVDSVASLVPQAELDGDISDNLIGVQARLMSKSMRKISNVCAKSGTTIIFINQIREKIGVMFGCLHADTPVNFVDGRSIPIKEVVDNQIDGQVWSWDEVTNQFVARNIVDWHDNGEVEDKSDWVSIAIKGPGTKNGRMHLTVTPPHELRTPTGWVAASELVVGDKLLTKQESLVLSGDRVNGTLGQFLTGVLAGDHHLAHNPKRLAASIKIRDNVDAEYARWKAVKLSAHLRFVERPLPSGHSYFESDCFSELLDLKQQFPKRDPMLLLGDDRFSWLGFAVWIMDDAHYQRERYVLSIKRFAGDFDKIEEISRALDDVGLYHHAGRGGSITFDKASSDLIAAKIAEFVPPCMRRKLPAGAAAYRDFELQRQHQWRDAYATVVEVREASGRQMKQRGKYDLSIDGTECYSAGGVANGVIVHNSPETTPGGKALKFYSSIRMDIRGGEFIDESKVRMGRCTKVKIVKNKVAPPFNVAHFNIMYGNGGYPHGIDKMGSLLDTAMSVGVVEANGSHYYYGDIKANGKEKFVLALKAAAVGNPTLIQEIREKTYKRVLGDKPIVPMIDQSDEELGDMEEIEAEKT